MAKFIKLTSIDDKEESLISALDSICSGSTNVHVYDVELESFEKVPGFPLAYWVSESYRDLFLKLEPFEFNERVAEHGASTKDDFRFLRCYWEVTNERQWLPYAKGGTHSPFYADVYISINWGDYPREIEAAVLKKYPYLNGDANWILHLECRFNQLGLFQTLRSARLAPHITPHGCIFGHNGFQANVGTSDIFAWATIVNSSICEQLFKLMLGRSGYALYTSGTMKRTPVPSISSHQESWLSEKGKRLWNLYRLLDSTNEVSRNFIAPYPLIKNEVDVEKIELEIKNLQNEVDDYVLELYGIQQEEIPDGHVIENSEPDENDFSLKSYEEQVLSWAVGVSFGRFKFEEKYSVSREATELLFQKPGLIEIHHGPEIFIGSGEGSLSDQVTLCLDHAKFKTNIDVNKWLTRNFFDIHLKLYTKSRRQAPIYWPLQTPSSSYTLWVYYHRVNEQTLYTCVNNFVGPKLEQVEQDLNALRSKGARSSQEEKELAQLTDLEAELKDFRDELLRLAKFWKPNLNDGVQITAAPLWKLFQHKAWQKKLKETWNKLEKGEYDWAHLACSIWPERVLLKCHQDRSLAIAHDVETIFWHEVEVPVKRGKKLTGKTKLQWQPKKLSDSELDALVKHTIAEMN